MELNERLLKLDHVKDLSSLSKTTIYRMMSKGTFPQNLNIGGKTRRWRLTDINEWLMTPETYKKK